MAVVFEPRQPVVPSISAAYGGAEAILRGNPSLLDAYQDAARLQASVAESRADRQFRGTQAGLDRAQDAAGQSAAAMGRFGQQQTAAQQAEFNRLDDRNNLVMQMQARAGAQQAEMQGRADLMKLEQYLAGQAMSQRDVQELEQRKRLLADVMAADDLAPEEKRAIGVQLMSGAKGINLLEMRQQATQAKMLEQRAKQYEAEVALQKDVQRKQGELNAKTLAQRTVNVPLAGGGTATLYEKSIDANGNSMYEELKPEPQADPIEQIGKGLKVAEALAKAAHPPTIDEITGKETLSPEYHKEVGRLLGELQGGRGLGGGGGATRNVTGGGEAPAGTTAQPPKPFNRYDPATQSPAQKEIVGLAGAQHRMLQADDSLAQEDKAPVAAAIDEGLNLMQKYGGPPGPLVRWEAADVERMRALSKTIEETLAKRKKGPARTAPELPAFEAGAF